MPVSRPRSGESQRDFIARCNKEMAGEFKDDKQRNAVCYRQWREKDKKPAARSHAAGFAFPNIAARLFETPLLIAPERLEAITRVLFPRFGLGLEFDASLQPYHSALRTEEDKAARFHSSVGGVYHMPVTGTLVHRSVALSPMSGLTSYQGLSRDLDAALESEAHTVLLDLDSGGGEAAGAFDLADKIFEARKQKKIIASVNEAALSASYLLASSAHEVCLSRTGLIGSIGAVAMHVDRSGENEAKGVKVTTIYSGAHKADQSPHAPLSDVAKAMIQEDLDKLYGMFIDTVARNRGLSTKHVRDLKAHVYRGKDAVDSNLANDIRTFDECMRLAVRTETAPRLATRNRKRARMSDDNQTDDTGDFQVVNLAAERAAARIEGQAQARAEAARIMKLCADAGLPDLAAGFMERGVSAEQAATIVEECALISLAANMGGLAAIGTSLVVEVASGRISLKAAHDRLLTAKAESDAVPISGMHQPNYFGSAAGGTPAKQQPTNDQIYRRLNDPDDRKKWMD